MGVYIFRYCYACAVYTLAFYVSKSNYVSIFGGCFSLAQCFQLGCPHRLRKLGPIVLAFCWIFGLVSGILVFLPAGQFLSSRMLIFPLGAMSIIGLLGVTALPFLLTIYLVFVSKSICIFPICFGKAFLYSFTSLCTACWLGLEGFLFHGLFFFSHCLDMPLLYLLWLRSFHGFKLFIWEALLLFALCILTGSVEYCIISPFLVSLLS